NQDIDTPTLDRLGASGIVFSNAVATTSTTLPAHASILTGLYPHRHQARVNSRQPLPQSIDTLAEILEAEGYRTAAFVSSFVLDAKFGLDQGFEHYDAEMEGKGISAGYAERSAAHTTNASIAWIKQNRKSPYFLWVHYYDVHSPYQAPIQFEEAAANSYDAEIASVDYQLGRLLRAVEAKQGGRRAETLVVVMADHGEALGEHGEQLHGLLVQEATIRVPLVVYATQGLPRGVHVPTRVSQIDLLPTIVSLLGASPPSNLDGVDLTTEFDPTRAVLTESVYSHAHWGWAPISAIYQGRWKYIDSPHPELYDLEADPLESVNLVAQRPREAAALASRLRERRGAEADRLPDASIELKPEEIARLRALGYVAGEPTAGELSARASSFGATLPRVASGPPRNHAVKDPPNPKVMLPLFREMGGILAGTDNYQLSTPSQRVVLSALGVPVLENRDALIEALEEFRREYPDFEPTYTHLAATYEAAGRPDDAARTSEKLAELISTTRAQAAPAKQ
nr:sulfatase-like hydrolase/transferase [Myxococcota bacterium]